MAEPLEQTDEEIRQPLEEQEVLKHFERRVKEAEGGCKEVWENAEEDQRFLRGGKGQWKDEDYTRRTNQDRPTLTINKILNVVNNVAGRENTARYQTIFLGRGIEDGEWADICSEFYRKARQRANFEQHESDAFRDMATSGISCLEMDQDLTKRPWGKGRTTMKTVPIWEMIWGNARERNLEDREWEARGRWVSFEEFYALFPEHEDLEDIVHSAAYASGWVAPGSEKTHRWPWLYVGEGQYKRKTQQDVFLVDYAWKQREIQYLIDNPAGGFMPVTREELFAAGDDQVPPNVPIVTWRVRQANIVGDKVLREKATPYEHLPRFFQTGYPFKQEEHVEFFGLVPVMKDPQQFSNLVTSASVSMMQHMAKGPMFYEPGAFLNTKTAQSQLATPNPHVALAPGGREKIHFEDPPRYPDFIDSYLRHADDAIYRPTGLDQTALGQIPDPRRVSGTVLQSVQDSVTVALSYLFDSLRLHRRSAAIHFLEMMQEHYDEEDIARVVGPEKSQQAQMDPQTGQPAIDPETNQPVMVSIIPPKDTWDDLLEFDVIPEEEPTTKSERERGWQFFTNTDAGLQMVLNGLMPPRIMAEVAPNIKESSRKYWLQWLAQREQAAQQAPPEEEEAPPAQ